MHQARTRRFSRARRLVIAGVSGILVAAGALVVVSDVGSGSAAPVQTTIFAASARPVVAAANDGKEVEVGVKFSPDVAIYATGVRFYKGSGNIGQHIGTLWGPTNNALRRVAFRSETASGWQTASFPSPVKLTAHANYLVSYHAMHGRYSYTQGYFTKTIDNGTVKMPASTSTSGNGVYKYGAFGFPASAATHATNYWVDATLSTTLPATTTTKVTTPTTKPVTTTTKPVTPTGWPTVANTGVPVGTALTAYTGSLDIGKCGVVIDSKIITGDMSVSVGNGTHAAGTPCVTIKNSLIKGSLYTGYGSQNKGPVLLADDEIAYPTSSKGVSNALQEANFYGYRLYIHGAKTGVACDGYCALHDSLVKGNYYTTPAHLDAFLSNGNYGHPMVLDHNAFACVVINPAAEDGAGGCSADVGLFGDFSAISNMTVTNNLFMASMDPAYCVYTGATQPLKAYPTGSNLVWRNNVWQRGTNSKCATYGSVADWKAGNGNIWCNNIWADGPAVDPGNACTG